MDEALPTRATLLNRLKDWRDEASWQDFFNTYWGLIYRTALKSGLSEAEAQDVVQETMICVAKQMPKFQYDPAIGSFKTWLLNLVRWRIMDQVRARKFRASDDVILEEGALDSFWETEWEKHIYEAAVNNVKGRIDPEKFQIFDVYVRRGMPAEKVASLFGITVNQVYLARSRITELLRVEAERLQKEML